MEPTSVSTELTVAEEKSSLAKAAAEVTVPDPEDEQAIAAIKKNTVKQDILAWQSASGACSLLHESTKLTITELDQR